MNDPAQNGSRKGPPPLSDATAPMAADAMSHEMVDINDIGDSLTLLAQTGDPVSIYPASGADVVMARIYSVDPELPHFVIELNEGSVLPAGECTCVAWLHNAKFQFRLSDPHWNALPDQPTLIPAEFPETCLVLNRRSSVRLEIPLGMDYTASFAFGGGHYELQLYDIAMRGVGLRCSPYHAKNLRVGRKLESVHLNFGPDAVITCNLEIRLSRKFHSFLGGNQVRVGCQFVNPSTQMLAQLQDIIKHLKDVCGQG